MQKTKNVIKISKATFYHAGCPVCVSAEHDIIDLVGIENVNIVHLGKDKGQISRAEDLGIKSVPALVDRTEMYFISTMVLPWKM